VTVTGEGDGTSGLVVALPWVVVTVVARSEVPLLLNVTVGVAALVTPTQPGAAVTEKVTPVALPAVDMVCVDGVTTRPLLADRAQVTTTPLAPGAATDFTVTVTGVVPVAVLQVRVAVAGETTSNAVACSRPGNAVNASNTGKSFKLDRLNNEESIMDHPFF
jgi:hypothetical protein